MTKTRWAEDGSTAAFRIFCFAPDQLAWPERLILHFLAVTRTWGSMKCDASWPSDACKIDRFRIDLWDPPQCSRRKSGVGYPSGYLAEWTHTSAEPSTVPFAHVTRPKWANVAGGISSCGRRSPWWRPRQDPLGWEVDHSAAGDHAPR